jgi:protein-S-isoprenylcysteine O-methyltransferase Ste14
MSGDMSGHSDLALRIFLPCYFIAYMLIGGVLAVARVRRKYGVDPLAVRTPDPLMSLGEMYRNVLFATTLVIVFVNAVRPSLLVHLGPLPYLQRPVVQVAGVVLLLSSLVLVRVSQIQMKGSWRFACDHGAAPTELITTGVYARSRNPIYLGMTLTGLALFLALPNAVTFSTANLTFLLLQVRIRVEEAYLMASHGDGFATYCRTTPRWFFRRRRWRVDADFKPGAPST